MAALNPTKPGLEDFSPAGLAPKAKLEVGTNEGVFDAPKLNGAEVEPGVEPGVFDDPKLKPPADS